MNTTPTPRNTQHLLFTVLALVTVFVLCWGQQLSLTSYCPAQASAHVNAHNNEPNTEHASSTSSKSCDSSEHLLAHQLNLADIDMPLLFAAVVLYIATLFCTTLLGRQQREPPPLRPPFQQLFCRYLE